MRVCGKGSEKAEGPLLTQMEAPRKGENLTPAAVAREAARRGCGCGAAEPCQNIL